jgi:hypothetical protein
VRDNLEDSNINCYAKYAVNILGLQETHFVCSTKKNCVGARLCSVKNYGSFVDLKWLKFMIHILEAQGCKFFFFNLHSGGWSPNWVHSARRPLIGLLYLPRVIVRLENLVE